MSFSRQNIHQQIHNWLLMAIAFTMAFPIKYNSWIISLCAINWILEGDYWSKVKRCYKEPLNILFLVFFALHALSVLVSDNTHEALAILERRASFIVFPILIFGAKNLSTDLQKKISLSFVCGVIISLLYCFLKAFIRYQIRPDSNEFFYHDLSSAVNMNAVYMAAYTILAIHVLIYYFKTLHKIITALAIAFLLFGCLMLNSKMMFAILLLGILYRFLSSKINLKSIVTLTGIFVVASLCIFLIPQSKQRISYEFTSNFEVLHQDQFRYDTHFTGTSLRLLLWKYCFEIQYREKAFLLGVGTGDYQDKLNQQYHKVGIYTGNPKLHDSGYLGYGPHNQYIEILFSLGIFALLIVVFIFYKQLQIAINYNHYLYIQLMLLMILFCITESVISTNKGIIFYTFFASIFIRETRKI
jgi:O-antigen ligase